MIGFRESEQVTICDKPYTPITVPFPIHECSGYYDKNRPSWEQMDKLAIDVVPAPLKPVGFKTGLMPTVKVTVGTPDEDDDE